MASAAIVLPHPRSPGSHGQSPVKSDTPSIRPPSPSAPPSMFAPHTTAIPAYERRDSAESEKDENGRSQSTPMTRPISPVPKRTNSSGNLPPFLGNSSAILSPPSFHATNHRNSSPESRRTRSSENLPTMGSSPDSSPQPQHSSLGGTPYHNGQGMSMRHPDHHLYSNQDYDSLMRPKKRHKTSRACDECRRKKIRCDATSEANVEQCSSCKRACVNCSFSRVPMKRGPTKGLEAQYIRELEDRLVSLEYSVQTKAQVIGRDHSPPPRRHVEYSGTTGTPPQLFKQPRPHQSEPVKLNPVLNTHSRNHLDRLPPIEAIHGSPPLSADKRHSTEYFRQPYHPSTHRHEPLPSHHYHSNHDHHSQLPDRRNSMDQSRRMSFSSHPVHERSASFNDAIGRRPSNLGLPEKPVTNGAVPIDDSALARYYEIYHPVLPVLPHNQKRLHSYLAAAPMHLRNALLHSIYALTSVDQGPLTPPSPRSPPPLPSHIDHTLKACDLIGIEAFVSDDNTHISLLRNLLHMQALLLLALNADKRSFSPPQVESPRGMAVPPLQEHGYTSRFVGSMMGAAWGCANEMKLSETTRVTRKRSYDQVENQEVVGDVDGEEALCRRAWWILVILDRWRAASTSSMPLISDEKIYLKDSDRHVLGEVTYHLVRLSSVLGHSAEVPQMASSPDVSINLSQVARLLNGELERVRETAELPLNHDPLLNVAFCHTKLLVISHTSEKHQSHGNVGHVLLNAAKKVVDVLQARNFNPNTPLIHHIIGFCTVVLVRLTNMADVREEAHKMLHDFLGDRKSSQFESDRSNLVEGYDVIAKKFLDNGRRQSEAHHTRRESESHYDNNGIGRLAHLAELAVGEGSENQYSDRSYQGGKYEAWRSIGGEEGLDGMVKRYGYLSALQTLLQSQ